MPKAKILIIDDEKDFTEMLKVNLESNGYEVGTASNGEEGLKKIPEYSPDLILLDIMMPTKDGYTFLRELKTKEAVKSTPVIVITAKPGMKDVFQVEGVKHYLVKPFEIKDLLLKIENTLSS